MCFDQQMVFDTRYPFESINVLRPPVSERSLLSYGLLSELKQGNDRLHSFQ